MINLSIILAFILGGIFSLGGKILQLFFSKPTLKSMSLFEQSMLIVMFHYMIPAILIYVILRLLKIDIWLKFNKSISIIFGIAIALYAFYLSVRIFAATIPGGGFSYAVRSMSPLVIYPAWILMIVALIWLLYKSFKGREHVARWVPITKKEIVTISIFSSLPIIFLLIMFVRPNGPLYLAYIAQKTFNEQCKLAGDSILEYPKNVKGVFMERTGHTSYKKINADNEYYSYGAGQAGFSFKKAHMPFMETFNYDKDRDQYKYLYIYGEHRIKTNNIKSNYRVSWENISNEEMKKANIFGRKIKIINNETNKTIASTIYFRSQRLRKICGHIVDGNFIEHDFVYRVFAK